MINEITANRYCGGDISEIENFMNAVKDKSQTWICHHRLETEGAAATAEQLKKQGLYYDRPASELIFLTRQQHALLHGKTTFNASVSKERISNQMRAFYHDENFKKQDLAYYRRHINSGTVQLRGKTYLGIWVINGIRYSRSTHTSDKEQAKLIVKRYVNDMLDSMRDV